MFYTHVYTGFKVDLGHLHTNIILLHITDDAASPSTDINLTADVASPSTDLNLTADVAIGSMTADELVARLKEAGIYICMC